MGKEILCDNRYPVVFIIFDARFDSKVKGEDNTFFSEPLH